MKRIRPALHDDYVDPRGYNYGNMNGIDNGEYEYEYHNRNKKPRSTRLDNVVDRLTTIRDKLTSVHHNEDMHPKLDQKLCNILDSLVDKSLEQKNQSAQKTTAYLQSSSRPSHGTSNKIARNGSEKRGEDEEIRPSGLFTITDNKLYRKRKHIDREKEEEQNESNLDNNNNSNPTKIPSKSDLINHFKRRRLLSSEDSIITTNKNDDDNQIRKDWKEEKNSHPLGKYITNRFKQVNVDQRIHFDTVTLIHNVTNKYAETKYTKAVEKMQTYESWKRDKKRWKKQKRAAVLSGEEKLFKIRYLLDKLLPVREDNPHPKRFHLQVTFHEHMINACLSKIYEREWESQYPQIMKKHNIKKMKREIVISCPRRFGKTYSVALFAAAYFLVVPTATIAIFSTGKRTAGKLMALIKVFLSNYPGFENIKVNTNSQEELSMTFGVNDIRSISVNCSSIRVCFSPFSSFLFFLFFFDMNYRYVRGESIMLL